MRVIYGVNNEGMGHATRSAAAIDLLLSHGHNVLIFSSGRAFQYLSQRYPGRVEEIRGFNLAHGKYSLRIGISAFYAMVYIPLSLPSFAKVLRKTFSFAPHVIVSDFEWLTDFAGKIMGIPVIAANNINVLNMTRLTLRGNNYPRIVARITATIGTLGANHYVIPTFFFSKPRNNRVTLCPPPIRKEIAKAKTKKSNHVLVYQTSSTCEWLPKMLKGIDEEFRVYGFGERPSKGKLAFHGFNGTRFIKDLATAKAVITGGGFTLISEALYLHKPVLSVPLRNHWEQIVNAQQVAKLGYGEYHKKLTREHVQSFLNRLPIYERNLKSYKADPNEFASTIEKVAQAMKRRGQLF